MTEKTKNKTYQPKIANALAEVCHIFISGLELEAMLGVHEHEKRQKQSIVLHADLMVSEAGREVDDNIANVVCYQDVVNNIKTIVDSGHVHLVETLAELIASKCLEDPRVLSARIRIDKPDAFDEVSSVGVEIERTQPRT